MSPTSPTSQPARSESPEGLSTVFIRIKVGNCIGSKAVADGMFETKIVEDFKPGLELATKPVKEKKGNE